MEQIEKAIATCSKDPALHARKVGVLASEGRFADAGKALEALQAIVADAGQYSGTEKLWQELGDLQAFKGHGEDAKRLFAWLNAPIFTQDPIPSFDLDKITDAAISRIAELEQTGQKLLGAEAVRLDRLAEGYREVRRVAGDYVEL